MIAWLKQELAYFHATFHDSETILWARLQYVFVLLLTAFNTVDLSPYISDKHLLAAYMLTNALVTELLRKNREDWSGGIK